MGYAQLGLRPNNPAGIGIADRVSEGGGAITGRHEFLGGRYLSDQYLDGVGSDLPVVPVLQLGCDGVQAPKTINPSSPRRLWMPQPQHCRNTIGR